nr:hypothetical protein [Thermomonospora amylolytica]
MLGQHRGDLAVVERQVVGADLGEPPGQRVPAQRYRRIAAGGDDQVQPGIGMLQQTGHEVGRRGAPFRPQVVDHHDQGSAQPGRERGDVRHERVRIGPWQPSGHDAGVDSRT